MTTITAQKRDMKVKAKKLRREGYVPGIVCSREIKDMLPIQFDVKDAMKLLRDCKKGEQVLLQVGEQKMHAIIKDVSYNALKRQVEIIDFQALVKGEKIHTAVDIVLKNEHLIQGSVTQEVSEIHYKADSDHLVDTIVLDFEQLRNVKSMKVSDLDMYKDSAITVQTPGNAVIFSVTESSMAAEAEPAAEDADK